MSSGGSRGVRRDDHEEEHEEHVNHEAWVIPYADMLTLLMGLFLVMFAISSVDAAKFEKLAGSLSSEFGGSNQSSSQVVDMGGGSGSSDGPMDGSESILDGGAGPAPVPTVAETVAPIITTPTVAPPSPTTPDPGDGIDPAAQGAYDELSHVKQLVLDRAEADGLADALGFRLEARGLVVTILTDQVLFEPGEAALQPGGMHILDIVADALLPTAYPILVEGHTDSRPISTAPFPSNWELSTARATSVLRHLVDGYGFDPARMSAAGYADTRPLGDNATPEGTARNRRVEIVVTSGVSLQDVIDAEATGASGGEVAGAPVVPSGQ